MRLPPGPHHAATRRALVRATAALALGVAALGGQAPRDSPGAAARALSPEAARLEAALDTARGRARIELLARIVDATRSDAPTIALARGAEALMALRHHPDDTLHVRIGAEMGWAAMSLGTYDVATGHVERALTTALRIGDERGRARALSNLGTIAQRRGQPEQAVTLFTEALAIQRRLGVKADIATSLNNLGFVRSLDLADYPQALADHLAALQLREAIGDSGAIALSHNNIGIVQSRLGQHDAAIVSFGRALAIRRALGQAGRIASTLSNIGDTETERGNPSAALVAHREAFTLRAALDDPGAVAYSHHNLGVAFRALGRVDSARHHLQAATRIGAELGDRGLTVRTLLALAALERTAGAPATAEALALRALAVADTMKSREQRRRAWEQLAGAREERGDARGALAAVKRYAALSDTIFTEATAGKVATLERRWLADRAQREVERVRAEQALEARVRTQQRNAALVTGVLIALVAIGLAWRRHERARLAEELSVTDTLTGTRNRRFVQQYLSLDVATVRRRRPGPLRFGASRDTDLVFMMLDLDHFKAINDDLGHAAGDAVLVEVARVIRENVRETDIVARWGGEEFLVIMRFTDRAAATAQAERLRAAIAAAVVALPGGRTVQVTCSIGVAVHPFVPGDPDRLDWESVVALADLGTYAAKRNGRDGWVTYWPTPVVAEVIGSHVSPAILESLVANGAIASESSRPDAAAVAAPSPDAPVAAEPPALVVLEPSHRVARYEPVFPGD